MNRLREPNKQSEQRFDGLKWTVIGVLLAAAIVANDVYSSVPVALRLIGWLVLACVIAGLALMTAKGQAALSFIKEARVELRKVVWPNRQETMQTTILVLGVVLLMAMVLWGLDSVLLWAIGFITGTRG